jgi:hypothetical protein
MNEGTPLGVKSTISHKASVLNKAPQRNFTLPFTYQCHSDAGKFTIAALCNRGCYAGGILTFVGEGLC